MSTPNRHRVAGLADLPAGGLIRVEVAGVPICLARAASGAVYALLDKCSHEEFPLSDGEVVGSEIECPIHLSRFDLRSGAACNPPATAPLQTFRATIEDDSVYVEL
jgi:3-phenylpropionate/trans-cinnamate dioxygenase ferredoxin component